MVFPAPILKETDELIFKKLEYHGKTNLRQSVTVECVVGLRPALGKITKTTLLIIDEADYCLLDDGIIRLPTNKHFKAIVALSASLPLNDQYDKNKL